MSSEYTGPVNTLLTHTAVRMAFLALCQGRVEQALDNPQELLEDAQGVYLFLGITLAGGTSEDWSEILAVLDSVLVRHGYSLRSPRTQ